MLPLSTPPPQMLQGSVLRSCSSAPTSLYSFVTSRISSWSRFALSCPHSPSPSATHPPLLLVTAAAASSSSHRDPNAVNPNLPLPHPSAPETERFRQNDDRDFGNAEFNDGRLLRSIGSRSEPSLPSIPGRFSKYSKPISKLHTSASQKRAERRDKKAFRKPMGDVAAKPDRSMVGRDESVSSSSSDSNPVSAGVRKRHQASAPLPEEQLPDWMKQGYQFSYSEVPSAPIVGFRQTPWSPFGPPDLMERPWTGSAPLKPSKKKLPEFDSFDPPPSGKKGVKFVQRPGPFAPGEGPKEGKTREEILGEPLTLLEISELINAVSKGSKQLNLGNLSKPSNCIIQGLKLSFFCNVGSCCEFVPQELLNYPSHKMELGIEYQGNKVRSKLNAASDRGAEILPRMLLRKGRDGLTHNMLDVVHNHWKRSVCCKIKCKGVPTIDMDNLARVVEERTGGVIIQRTGGVLYVFRGRNYNWKNRPKIPIMLWKPPDPIYPQLIQPIPEGLTEEEAKYLRAKGRKVAPLCKLSKNGVYLTLVAEVRAQLQLDEVVRVDCTGLHPTDYKKLGAKLRDLVPCTLLSFEKEQIIVFRKKQLAPVESAQPTKDVGEQAADISNDILAVSPIPLAAAVALENIEGSIVTIDENLEAEPLVSAAGNIEDAGLDKDLGTDNTVDEMSTKNDEYIEENPTSTDMETVDMSSSVSDLSNEAAAVSARDEESTASSSSMAGFDEFDVLFEKAIEEGTAIQLGDQSVDPDIVFEKAAELAAVPDSTVVEDDAADEVSEKQRHEEQNRVSSQVSSTSPFDERPLGGIGVDELAKLLAP